MLYIQDASFVDWRTLRIRRGHLKVAPGPKGDVRFVSRIPQGASVLDCSGRLVTKSFVIAHHHLYSALALGMPLPPRAPRNFAQMLKLVWWNLDRKLDAEMVRACALAGGIEAAKCGATFLIDHHSSPNATRGSLDIIASALDDIGLSHLLCLELSDRDGERRREEGLAETNRYLSGRQGLVGLHASFTVSDGLLKRAVALAETHATGIHAHVAEALSDENDCIRRRGIRILERFSAAGALRSPKTILAHGLHLDKKERAIFRRSPAWLVQNQESNQNNGVGDFDSAGLGGRLMLGTDGLNADMLASTRAAYLAGRARGGMSPLDAYRRLRKAHEYLAVNGFTGDGENNLVILDYAPPTPVTPANLAAHFLYGLGRCHVESVISAGRLIVRRRRMVGVDEDKIREFTSKQAEKLWRRL
ncbi:MAG TPA: amidohydrolase [Elusimicrobia bacterium]|nr:amidohydrolase [Elusimicrobiota bacterium]